MSIILGSPRTIYSSPPYYSRWTQRVDCHRTEIEKTRANKSNIPVILSIRWSMPSSYLFHTWEPLGLPVALSIGHVNFRFGKASAVFLLRWAPEPFDSPPFSPFFFFFFWSEPQEEEIGAVSSAASTALSLLMVKMETIGHSCHPIEIMSFMTSSNVNSTLVEDLCRHSPTVDLPGGVRSTVRKASSKLD